MNIFLYNNGLCLSASLLIFFCDKLVRIACHCQLEDFVVFFIVGLKVKLLCWGILKNNSNGRVSLQEKHRFPNVSSFI